MKKSGGEFPIVDHRELKLDIDLGGTSFCFESMVGMDDGRIRAIVVDEYNQRWTKVERVPRKAGLFEVTNHYGGTVDYDTSGNLQRLRLPTVEFFESLDEEDRQNFLPEFLEAMDDISLTGEEVVMDVDLREGLADGSGMGWVYLVCESKRIKKFDHGKLVGFEVGPKVVMRNLYGIGLYDRAFNQVIGKLLVKAEIREGMLFVVVGDGKKMALTGRRLKVDPALFEAIDTPTGTLSLLSSLRSGGVESGNGKNG